MYGRPKLFYQKRGKERRISTNRPYGAAECAWKLHAKSNNLNAWYTYGKRTHIAKIGVEKLANGPYPSPTSCATTSNRGENKKTY